MLMTLNNVNYILGSLILCAMQYVSLAPRCKALLIKNLPTSDNKKGKNIKRQPTSDNNNKKGNKILIITKEINIKRQHTRYKKGNIA